MSDEEIVITIKLDNNIERLRVIYSWMREEIEIVRQNPDIYRMILRELYETYNCL